MSIVNYIIRIAQEPISLELAQNAAASCQQYSLEYHYFDAVYKHNLDSVYQEHSLRVYEDPYLTGPENYMTSGTKGCAASHYLLWKLCLELDQTICVLEHDAVWIRPFNSDLLKQSWDVLHLDWRSNKVENYYDQVLRDHGTAITAWCPGWRTIIKRPFKRLKKLSISGSHSYLIRPRAAAQLLTQVDQQGILPSDVQLNAVFCDLKYTETSYCQINPKYFVPKTKHKSQTIEGFTTRNW